MARTKSISAIESELSKAEADLKKAQKKVDDLSALVLKLQRQKQEYEAKQIVNDLMKWRYIALFRCQHVAHRIGGV